MSEGGITTNVWKVNLLLLNCLSVLSSYFNIQDINDALGYIVSYKFLHVVGINEGPQKGFSGTRCNTRELASAFAISIAPQQFHLRFLQPFLFE